MYFTKLSQNHHRLCRNISCGIVLWLVKFPPVKTDYWLKYDYCEVTFGRLFLAALCCSSHSSVLSVRWPPTLTSVPCTAGNEVFSTTTWVGRLTRLDEFQPCLASGWCWFPTPVACLAYLCPLKEMTSSPGWCAMSVMMIESWPWFMAVTSQSKHTREPHMMTGILSLSTLTWTTTNMLV